MKKSLSLVLLSLLSGCAYFPQPMYGEKPVVVQPVEVITSNDLTQSDKINLMAGYFEGCVQTAVKAERINGRVPKRPEIQGYCTKQVVDNYPWVAKLSRFDLSYGHSLFEKILDKVNWTY